MGAVAGWLTGCNQGVFIDDFRSEVEQVQLESDEDEVTLCFQTDDWTVEGGELSHSLKGQFSSFFFQQYNDQGEHIGTQESPSLDMHGSLSLHHPLIELYIEHLRSGELTVRVVENLLPECTLFLVLADKEMPEIQQFIRIQLQTAKYELEGITYTLNTWGEERKDGDRVLLSVTNNADTPTTITLYPWKEEHKQVRFRRVYLVTGGQGTLEKFDPFYLLEHPVEVEIPTFRKGFGFEMKGEKALLTGDWQQQDLPKADEERKVTVAQGEKIKIRKKVHYEAYDNDCVFRFRNVKTHKVREFSASFYQQLPTDIQVYTEKVK
ncbi:hypothetical protein EVA_00677 [gut metagenome]|uniref:Uncharacterized protein n=1 Tax=gut metagenome TaxID=749906 RepID=J9GRZ9_9ZZZZ